MRSSHVLLLVALTLATSARSAHADEPTTTTTTNPALAEALFQEARRLDLEGRTAEACAKFEESQRQDPTLGTLLNLALCQEKIGQLVSAWTLFNRAAVEAARSGQTERAELARSHARALEPQLPRLQIDVPSSSGVTEVKVDGKPLGSAGWNVPLPYDAGEHVIELLGTGRVAQTLRATTTASEVTHLAAPMLREEPKTVVEPLIEPRPEPVPPRADAPRASTPTLGYAALGVGVLGIGVGSVFGALALGKKSDVDDHCRAERCDPTGLDAASDARTFATVSTIGFAVGVVAAAGGAYLVLFGGKRSASGPRASLNASLGGVGISGAW